MYPMYSYVQDFQLHEDDVQGIQYLYGEWSLCSWHTVGMDLRCSAIGHPAGSALGTFLGWVLQGPALCTLTLPPAHSGRGSGPEPTPPAPLPTEEPQPMPTEAGSASTTEEEEEETPEPTAEPSPVDPSRDACIEKNFDAITEINGELHFFKNG